MTCFSAWNWKESEIFIFLKILLWRNWRLASVQAFQMNSWQTVCFPVTGSKNPLVSLIGTVLKSLNGFLIPFCSRKLHIYHIALKSSEWEYKFIVKATRYNFPTLSWTNSIKAFQAIACELPPPPRLFAQVSLHAGYVSYASYVTRLATSRLFISFKGAKRTRKSERSKLQRGCAATERARKLLPTGPGCSKLR